VQRASDPRLLARLARLELRARTAVEGLAGGRHRSPLRGASTTFAEHREYTPGDDLRHLDWRVIARSDRNFVRQYEEETDLTGYLVLDASASMRFSTLDWTKLDYATWTVAALARLLVLQHDSAGLFVTAGEALEKWLPPGGTERHWHTMVEMLEGIQPEGSGDPALALETAAARMERRGLVVWVSDCLGDPDLAAHAAGLLRHKGHDLLVLRTLDPAEVHFPFGRSTRFDPLELGERLLLDPRAIRNAYLQEFEDHARRLRLGLRSLNVDFLRMETDQALEIALSKFLALRTARMRRAGR